MIEDDDGNDDQADAAQPIDSPVGYKRPPLHSRFKPGHSGNRKGRPKGRRNLKHDLHEEFSERINLREGDRTIRITKQRAVLKSMVARAIKGDVRAQSKIFEQRAFGFDDELRSEAVLGADDQAILAAFLARSKGTQ